MGIKKNWIYTLDFVIISATAIALLFIFNNINPLVIAPFNEEETTTSTVLFEFKNADYIFIDDNIEFTSPEKIFVEDNILINLKPGVYYWKLKGITESEIRTITIISKVDLRLRETNKNCSECDSSYEVINAGNENLNVDVYSGENFTGNFVLNKNENKNSSGTKFIGVAE